MPVPEMGIKYTFDDSEASRGIKRINQMLQTLDITSQNVANTASGAFVQVEKMIRQLQISGRPLGGTLSLAQENIQRIDQIIGQLSGVSDPIEHFSNTMAGAIHRYTQISTQSKGFVEALRAEKRAAAEASAAHQRGQQALDQAAKAYSSATAAANELQQRMADWRVDPLTRSEQKVKDLADANERLGRTVRDEGDEERSRAAKAMQGLRRWRWELVTLIFFINRITRLIRGMWNMMAESEEQAVTRAGLRAMAVMYRRNADVITRSMREVSITSVSTMELVGAVQRGFLQDQGRFATRYAELWEAAQRTAAAAGEDAVDHFEGFLEAMAKADAEILDSTSGLFHAQSILQEYGTAVGIAADDLDDLTTSTTIYNHIMEVSNQLQATGIDDDLERADSVKSVKDAWAELRDVTGSIWRTSGEAQDYFNKINKGLASTSDLVTFLVAQYTRLSVLRQPRPAALLPDPDRVRRAQEAYESIYEARDRALGLVDDEGVGPGLDEYPSLMKEVTDKGLTTIANHLLRRRELIEENGRRVEKINRENLDRNEDIEIRHQQRLDKIDRDYQRNKASKLRRYNRRADEERDDFLLKELQAERDHLKELRHQRERYQLTTLQNERLYNYERMMLIAEGDVLAIEDLDARYDLEQRARKENQQQRARETKEDFREDQTQRLEKYKLELDHLKDAYRDQLNELRIQWEDQQLEAEIQRKEAMRTEERDYNQRLRDQADSHKLEMDQWAEHWGSIAKQTELGTAEVSRIIRDYFGPGGETSQIIQQFLARYQQLMDIYANIEKIKSQVASTTPPVPFRRPPVGVSEEVLGFWQYAGRPYQFGGSGLVTRPTLIPMGESGPERFNVQPVSLGGSLVLQWGGGPIPVHGTGDLTGMDLSGIGDVIARGLVMEMSNQLAGRRI